MKKVLLIDIGGTNLRYAYAEAGSFDIFDSNKESLDSLSGFNDLLSSLLLEGSVRSLVISVAGPMMNGTIQMTNRDFSINADNIKQEHDLDYCKLLNDWESIGYSLSCFKNDDISFIKNGDPFNNKTLFMGPGTGLGAALVIGDDVVMPSEIGNTTILTERLLKNFDIENNESFVTLEEVVSGSAIAKLYYAISGSSATPEEVIELFHQGDKAAEKVIKGFTISLAEVISDLALIFISGNGIYLAGGLIRTLVELIDKDLFIKSFLSNKKSIHKNMLNLMPIGVINKQYTCLYGNLNFYNLRIK